MTPDKGDIILRPLMTRLFPKSQGADAYDVSGIAALCDWVVLSDIKPPFIHLHRNRQIDHPRHIFLSLRAPFHALRAFVVDILPKIEAEFVLVTGSEDITLPRQTDARWRAFSAQEQAFLLEILNHAYLRHWYCENLDQSGDAKRSPLPLGLVFPDGSPSVIISPSPPLLAERPTKVFCAHRHREGPQWLLRRRVSALADGPWRDFCTVPDSELSEPDFMAEVERHAFVLCAEGGGIDPSPKAWSALLHGAIPIIRATALAPAYAHLPVVMVNDWRDDALTQNKLTAWRDKLQPWFDEPEKRQEVVRRLSIDYWWKIIAAGKPVETTYRLAVG